jgi:hypothetical protein
VRTELAADGSLFEGYHPRMAAEAAWLIVQHAIAQPAFQRRALELLRAAVRRDEARALKAAMLEDRIRTLEGRPQRYGTQFDWDASGQLSPLPIEDAAGVDARRREIGLRPLEEATQDLRIAAEREGERPPPNWAARQREMEAWCRQVGWRDRPAEITSLRRQST